MIEGDVVIIRSRAYKVVGFTDDGEPRLIRIEGIVRLPGGGVWASE